MQTSPRANGEQTSFDTFVQRLDDTLHELRPRDDELGGASIGELVARRSSTADEAEARKLTTALHERFAHPLASFSFALLALPLAFAGRRASRAAGAITGLIAALSYYGLAQLGGGLVANRVVSAAAGAWLPNAVVTLVALLMLVRRDRIAPSPFSSRRRARDDRRASRPSRATRRPPRFVLPRYVARQFAGMFLVAFGLLLVGYVIVDVLERLQWFARFDAGPGQVARFYALRIPLITSRVLSPALLLGTALTISIMSSQHELVAIRACGVSMSRVVVPILLIAAAATPCLLALNEVVLPITNTALDRYKTIDIKRRDGTPGALETMVWLGRTGSRLVQAMRLAPTLDRADDLSIFDLDHDGMPVSRLDARSARHVGDGIWELTDARQNEVSESGLREVPGTNRTDLGETPRGRVDVMHLGLAELAALIRDDGALGLDTRALRTDWHSRLATPLACLLLPAVALALANHGPPFPGAAMMLLLSTLLAIGHTLLVSVTTALGYGGWLPPFVAGWAPMIMLAGLAWLAVVRPAASDSPGRSLSRLRTRVLARLPRIV
jgi:lipopolysaccharide export system permease protein